MSLLIVIPAYNEERRIERALAMYSGTIAKKYGDSLRVVVVSDGTDGTEGIVRRFAKTSRWLSIVQYDHKLGKGGAVIEGLRLLCREAKPDDIIGFLDADGAVDGNEAIRLVGYVESGKTDCVVASRYMKGSRILGGAHRGSLRRTVGVLYGKVTSMMFGFHLSDTQCGAKFFRVRIIKKILKNLYVLDGSIDLNILYEVKREGHSFMEVPIVYHDFSGGMKLRYYRIFKILAAYRIRTLLGLGPKKGFIAR